jgi:hypothetical protein
MPTQSPQTGPVAFCGDSPLQLVMELKPKPKLWLADVATAVTVREFELPELPASASPAANTQGNFPRTVFKQDNPCSN